MYTVDDKDLVVELTDIPPSDGGAPIPTLLASEHLLALAYYMSDPNPNWDGKTVKVVRPDRTVGSIAVVRFKQYSAVLFGHPNDEVLSGHPLYERGLKEYMSCEVKHSSWIRSLERVNSVHPSHSPSHFESDRHFILAFHDSTFECVADGYSASVEKGTMAEVIARVCPEIAT